MEPLVIYDSELELATIVDSEVFRSLGPVAVGPNAKAELQQFVDHMMPVTLDALDSYALSRVWGEFWTVHFSQQYDEPSETAIDALVEATNNTGDAERLAEHEAAAATATPDVQPHDTDVATVTVPPHTVTAQCYNCNGDGVITHGETGETVQCGICNGSGKVTLPA